MINLRNLTLLLGALLLVSGCANVTFPEPMPPNRKNKTEFPKSMQGVWLSEGQDDSDLEDRLVVNPLNFVYGDDLIELGDDTVLRKYCGYYIISQKDEDSKDRWTIIFTKVSKEKLEIYHFDGNDDAKIAIWEKILGETVEGKTKEYMINPVDNRTFRKLIKEGGISHLGDYVR